MFSPSPPTAYVKQDVVSNRGPFGRVFGCVVKSDRVRKAAESEGITVGAIGIGGGVKVIGAGAQVNVTGFWGMQCWWGTKTPGRELCLWGGT